MFNPVAEAIAKILEPMAEEVRRSNADLQSLLRGITTEQQETNRLLQEILSGGASPEGGTATNHLITEVVAGQDRAATELKKAARNPKETRP